MSVTYRGRFAPSPSGPLHFGSLVAAVGSFLHAKIHAGKWLVRIEDIDQTRVVKGAADDILRTLDALALHWDESVRYQTDQLALYDSVLACLSAQHKLYRCNCTRKMIKAMGGIYDKRCRIAQHNDISNTALRFINDGSNTSFFDENLGWITPEKRFVEDDVVVKRRDGLHAYQLVVVVDDIDQDITHVVRGADLLDLTPVQQRLFTTISDSVHTQPPTTITHAFHTTIHQRMAQQRRIPKFLHLPLAVTAPHQKLSKQNHAMPINLANKAAEMHRALQFLGIPIPAELAQDKIATQLEWAIAHHQTWHFNTQTEILVDTDT